MRGKQDRKAKAILQRYVAGKCTAEERAWVAAWLEANDRTLLTIVPALKEKHLSDVWQALEQKTASRRILPLWKGISIAATLIAMVGIGVWYVGSDAGEPAEPVTGHTQPAIQAGSDQALLTLADGRTVQLDRLSVGNQIDEKGITLTKTDSGTLSYASKSGDVKGTLDEAVAVTYNTVTTPRGGQFKIILPDHSVVWINAATTLRFPVPFTGTTRTVALEGEGYFEVAHDPHKPFIVTSGQQQTIVKGTKFNLTAYPEDARQVTTLLEGAVLVKTEAFRPQEAEAVWLHPNEQAVLHNKRFTTAKIDAREAVAWKNGKFVYHNTPLATIMKQLARWYDVEIVYQEAVREITFTGSVSRFDNIEDVLRKISLTESVQFEIDERRIMIRH